MLTILKVFNLLMSVVDMVMNMCRDEKLRQAGRDSVGAAHITRLTKARGIANDRIKSFDDALAVARSKLWPNGDNRD